VQSFLAFCLIDQEQYEEAYNVILIAQELNAKLLSVKMIQMSKSKRQGLLMSFMGKLERRMSTIYPTTASEYTTSTKAEVNGAITVIEDEEDEEDEDGENDINLKATYDEYITKKKPAMSALESELIYLRRVDFIILYHISVAVYMQRLYEKADEVHNQFILLLV